MSGADAGPERTGGDARVEASELRFRELFEWANTGIVKATPDGRFVEANPAYCAMVGYTESELIGTEVSALTHPDDRLESQECVERMLSGDLRSTRLEKRYIRQDGQTIWAAVAFWLVRDDQGLPLYRMATIQDITAHKDAEERLVRSQSLQRVAGKLARVGGWALSVSTMEFAGSQELHEILKGADPGGDEAVPLEEALARVPAPYQDRIASALLACVTGGVPFDLELPMADSTGGEIWIRVVAEAQIKEDGTVERVVGAFQDITERRQADDTTRQVAERLTMTVDSITDGFFTLDRSWMVTYVNRSAEEILQRPLVHLVGHSFWDEFPEVMDSEAGAAYRRAMEHGTTEVLEASYFPSLGAWLAVRAYPSAEGLAVFFHDVTEQRRSIEVLRDRETRLAEQAALLDAASDAIIVRDLDHRITYWNRSAATMYGWSAEEALGRSIRELLYPGSSAFDEATVELLDAGGWQGELTALTKDHRELVADGRETLVHDEIGQPKSVLSIMTDITERKQRDLQYWRAQRMESIGTLAAGVAHDLNNALMPVMMATDLLQDDETDPSRRAMLDSIETGTQRATEMVRQLLSYVAGVEGRRLSIDVGGLLSEVERIANDTFLKTIRVVREDATDLSPVSGDATQLNQVLINLCVNARDAMPDGGTLVLAAENVVVNDRDEGVEPSPGRYVRIRVEDDGQGMAPDVLDRIFEPFYSTKAHGHGTGLGLSTSIGIVKSHGGFIRVNSTPGKGTRFLVHLPAAVDPASTGAPSSPGGRPAGDEGTVLIVDDEVQVRTMLRFGLQRAGYQVLEASSGADAVALVARAENAIDVVVTDMMMPGMDGLETIRAIKAVRPGLPVILVSGLHAPSMSDAAGQVGVRHVLSKPFTITTLLQTLRNATIRPG